MDNFNVVNTLDTNNENDNSSENSESSENDKWNTMLNNLCIYDENITSNVMICSGITIVYYVFLCFLFYFFLYYICFKD